MIDVTKPEPLSRRPGANGVPMPENTQVSFFCPEMVGRLIAAYGATVAILEDRSGPFRLEPCDAIHERIANAILREARAGVDGVDQLKALALRALCASISPIEQADRAGAEGAAARPSATVQ